jgi:hypothetical protein
LSGNPYLNKKNAIKLTKLKIFILIIFFIAWAGLLFFLPYFSVKKVSYEGLNLIETETIDAFVKKNFLEGKLSFIRKNFFIVSSDKIATSLFKEYPLLSATVEKIFPAELRIKVVEKKPAIIYDNEKKYFLLGKEGTAIKFLRDVEPSEYLVLYENKTTASSTIKNASSTSDYVPAENNRTHIPSFVSVKNRFGKFPLIYDTRKKSVENGQESIFEKDLIEKIIQLTDVLEKEGTIRANYFVLDEPTAGFKIKTNLAWDILIQPAKDINSQINNLKTILANNRPTEYVDLRFDEKVYWK